MLTVQVFGRPRLALAVVAAALTMPAVLAGSTLMTIDAPYTCLWGWALVFAYRAVRQGGWAWEATGLCVGLGILAKYTMVVFLPSLGLFLLLDARHRRLLFSGGLWSMVGITLLCCVPILAWNGRHDWVSLQHVKRLAGLAGEGPGELRWLGPLAYLGTQAGLGLLFWFAAWLAAMLAWNPLRVRDTGVRFLWWLSAPMFLLFLGFSLKTGGGEPNWPATAYLSGGVLAAGWLAAGLESAQAPARRLLAGGAGLAWLAGLALCVVLHRGEWAHPALETLAGPPTAEQPYPLRRLDPTCRLRGWRTLAARVDELRRQLAAQGEEPVLAAGNWGLPGELGAYCAGHPEVHSIGLLQGDRHSQYDYWGGPLHDPEPFLGRTFILVGCSAATVRGSFDRIDPPVFVEHREDGRALAGWVVLVCRGFRGFPALPSSSTN